MVPMGRAGACISIPIVPCKHYQMRPHGLLDLTGYEMFLAGKLTDYSLPEEEMQKNLESIKNLPKPPAAKTGKW